MDVNKLLNPVEARARDTVGYHYGQNDFPFNSEPPRSESYAVQQKYYARQVSNPFAAGQQLEFAALQNLAHLAGRPTSVEALPKAPRGERLSNLQTASYLSRMQGGRNLSASSASSTDSFDSSSTIRSHDLFGRSLSYDHGYSQLGLSHSVGSTSPTPSQLSAPAVISLSPMSETMAINQKSTDPNDISGPPRCSYCTDCQTKSPLRKVVSHIFGRNKAETRAIPKNVWVYYCRKHYQRSRYRNPKGFAVLQCELVRRQIARLQAWGGVESWSVKVRQPKAGKKPEATGSSDGSDDEGEQVVETTGTPATGAADSPEYREWLTRYEGENRTMEEITELIMDIERNVDMSGGTFPDVELLPHCYTNPTEEEHDENAWMKESHRRKNGPRGSSGRKVRNKGGALAALETKQKRKAASDAPHMQMDDYGSQKKHCLREGIFGTSLDMQATLKSEEPSEIRLMPLEDSGHCRTMLLAQP